MRSQGLGSDIKCSKCGGDRDNRSHRYCNRCHAAYMRAWRRSHPPSEEQRRKGIARAYARVYLSRGKLQRGPCEDCGVTHDELTPVEMHHADYDKPLEVTWLCRECHLDRHSDTDSGILASGDA